MIPPPAIRRILVALDATLAGEAALEAAAALATDMEAELFGIFVENEDVLRFAALPFARETGVAATRRLDRADIERLLKIGAARAEAALARAAERQRVHWSFRIRRGRMLAELLADADSADLLAFAREGACGHGLRAGASVEEALPGKAGAALMLPARAKLGTPISVIFEDTPAGIAALALATRLARGSLDGPLQVLVPVPPGSAAAWRREAHARERIARLPIAVDMMRVPAAPLAALAAAVRAARPGTLVMGADPALAKALKGLAAPLLVVRPGSVTPTSPSAEGTRRDDAAPI